VGPFGIEKHDFLRQLRQYIPGHDHVMVGNILGISGRATTVALRSAQAGASSNKASSPKGSALRQVLGLKSLRPIRRTFEAQMTR